LPGGRAVESNTSTIRRPMSTELCHAKNRAWVTARRATEAHARRDGGFLRVRTGCRSCCGDAARSSAVLETGCPSGPSDGDRRARRWLSVQPVTRSRHRLQLLRPAPSRWASTLSMLSLKPGCKPLAERHGFTASHASKDRPGGPGKHPAELIFFGDDLHR